MNPSRDNLEGTVLPCCTLLLLSWLQVTTGVLPNLEAERDAEREAEGAAGRAER